MQSFAEELALCVAANGAKGPALLWPEDPKTLSALLELPVRPVRNPAPIPPCRADRTRRDWWPSWAAGCTYGCAPLPLPVAELPAVESAPNGAECTVTFLEGACRCVLSRGGEDPAPRPSHPLGMRLRSGGTLFVPRNHAYRLSEIHAPTTLLELRLESLD
ncbi:hypothetical protein NKH18_15510 [Streptomyces sp. M10(2022)]